MDGRGKKKLTSRKDRRGLIEEEMKRKEEERTGKECTRKDRKLQEIVVTRRENKYRKGKGDTKVQKSAENGREVRKREKAAR